MRGPHNLWRLVRTGATFERTGAIRVILEGFGAPLSVRILARTLAWPFTWLGLRGDPALPPVTRALTALGPSYIKFGQILSTRPDIVGEKMALQLKYLQDQLRHLGYMVKIPHLLLPNCNSLYLKKRCKQLHRSKTQYLYYFAR